MLLICIVCFLCYLLPDVVTLTVVDHNICTWKIKKREKSKSDLINIRLVLLSVRTSDFNNHKNLVSPLLQLSAPGAKNVMLHARHLTMRVKACEIFFMGAYLTSGGQERDA